MVKSIIAFSVRGLFLLCFFASLASCTRAGHDDQSRIVVEIPPFESQSQSSSKVSSLSYVVEPRTLSDINCLYLVAAADEPSLSGLKCGTVNADNSLEEVFTGGVIYGGARLTTADAAKLEILMTPGKARHFYLLGAKRSRSDGCLAVGQSLKFPSSQESINSNLYVLGHSARYDLEGGTTIPIEMPVSLDTTKWIKECRGTVEDKTPTLPNALATAVLMQKASSPGGNTAVAGECTPFIFDLRNPLARLSYLTSSLTVEMEMDATGSNSDNYATVDTFSSHTGCTSNTSGGDISLPSPSTEVLRWIKMPALNAQGRISMSMKPSILNIITVHFSSLATSKVAVDLKPSSYKIFEVEGPMLIAAGDHCYKHEVTVRDLAGLSFSGDTFEFSSASGDYQVFLNPDCTSEVTSSELTAPATIYIKYLRAQGSGRHQVVIQPTGTSGTPPKTRFIDVFKLGFSQTPANLGILGPSAIRIGQCERLFATIQNSFGATLPDSVAGRSVTVSSSGSVIYTDSNCSPTAQTSHTITFSGGDTMQEFYVKSASTNNLTLSISSSGLTSGSKAITFQAF